MKTLQLFLIAFVLAICASMVLGFESDENEFEEWGYEEEEEYDGEYDLGEEADDEDDED